VYRRSQIIHFLVILALTVLPLVGMTNNAESKRHHASNNVSTEGIGISVDVEFPRSSRDTYYALAFVKSDRPYTLDIFAGYAGNPDKQKGTNRYKKLPAGNWMIRSDDIRLPRGCKQVNTRVRVYSNQFQGGSTLYPGYYTPIGQRC
jgi:hypothetical protein